jgi:hypothetical protein
MSAWITVVITFERMLAVTIPLRVAMLSTPCRARLLLAVLCIVCPTVTAYPMWTVRSMNQLCKIFDSTYHWWFNVTYAVGSLALPEVLLIVLSSSIFFHLARSGRLHTLVCDLSEFLCKNDAAIAEFLKAC